MADKAFYVLMILAMAGFLIMLDRMDRDDR